MTSSSHGWSMWMEPWTQRLAIASLQGAALFVVLAVFLRWRGPRVPASTRALLWWLVSFHVLVVLAPLPAVLLPVLSSPDASHAAVAPVIATDASRLTGREPVAPPAAPPSKLPSWQLVVAWAWLTVVVASTIVSVYRSLATLTLARRARPVEDAAVLAVLARLCARLGLARVPELRSAADVGGPQVLGPWRPVVLLPAGLDASSAELEMALCHELFHIRRRDLWWGWVPTLARRLFFFHPLVALAVREYALAREGACDAAVLTTLGSAPRDYGRAILRWGVLSRETGLAVAVAAPSVTLLRRRLLMLDQVRECVPPRRTLAWIAVCGVLLAALPIQLVARPAEKATRSPGASSPASSSSAVFSTFSATVSNAFDSGFSSLRPVIAGELSWLFSTDREHTFGVGPETDADSLSRLHSYREKPDEPLLWFRVEQREYLVRDAEFLRRVAAVCGSRLRPPGTGVEAEMRGLIDEALRQGLAQETC